jgi:hypothetical protein
MLGGENHDMKRRSQLIILAFGSALFAGCHSDDYCRRDCEQCAGAMPAPLGTYVRGHQDVQAAAAQESKLVIYRHEWYLGQDKLGTDGRRHVDRLASRMVNEPIRLNVEREVPDLKTQPDIDKATAEAAKLDEVRRRQVVARLQSAGVADADSRVVTGESHAEGLNGNMAPRLFYQQLRGTGGRGGGGGFGGGEGGGGFGGGGGGGGGFGGGGGGGGGGLGVF